MWLAKVLFKSKTEDVQSAIMKDLDRVRADLHLEMQRFKVAFVSEKLRGQRLLYLFQKDLVIIRFELHCHSN
jgi:hypothetical protein